ncbi:hypothetical protein DSO57_1015913 [Entomophthora muscae]|uniref:Uncharacterized protein n=1 Tax=Entomophthora muscae TaxID=34485 RepID=A0ACC2RW96_9FUNG|nr:hypothetical protein DSO57_1015913 [Entomophthora muscae]
MKGTQQQSTISPIVYRGCSCSCGSKNRVSATQMPTQEGDRRGEFDDDAALTQPCDRTTVTAEIVWNP